MKPSDDGILIKGSREGVVDYPRRGRMGHRVQPPGNMLDDDSLSLPRRARAARWLVLRKKPGLKRMCASPRLCSRATTWVLWGVMGDDEENAARRSGVSKFYARQAAVDDTVLNRHQRWVETGNPPIEARP